MYTQPSSNYLRRSLVVNNPRTLQIVADPIAQKNRVLDELRNLGVTKYGMWKLATKYLPHTIQPDEHIGGAVYGWLDKIGSVMLVATNKRIIYLNKKPLFLDEDEVKYDMVAGVDYSQAGFGCTVILHTRVREYVVHTLNKNAARKFVSYIEEQSFENN